MPAPEYPSIEQLTAKLAGYVDVDMASSSADAGYVTDCALESKEWLDRKITEAAAVGIVPVNAYTRAFLEVGAQLFRRRRSWSNIDPLEAPAVPPVRSNPYSAAYPILEPYIGPVMGVNLTERRDQITAQLEAAIRDSGIPDADKVTVGNSGTDYMASRSPAAGGVILYAFPRLTLPAPRGIRRITWTIGILATGKGTAPADRCAVLLDVVTDSGVVAWRAAEATVVPTDFAVSEDPAAPKIPGWAVQFTEEHLP